MSFVLRCSSYRHLHFLINLLAQNTGRLYKKYNDQDCENDGVGKLGRDVCLAQVLDHAQKQAADKSARNGADSAEYGGNEGP